MEERDAKQEGGQEYRLVNGSGRGMAHIWPDSSMTVLEGGAFQPTTLQVLISML